MTRCHSQWDVLQNGKGKEAIKPRARAGPGGVADGQDYVVRYTAKKTKRSAGAVKAVKKVGSSRQRVERRLGR